MAAKLEINATLVFFTPSKTVVCIPPGDMHMQILFSSNGEISGYKYYNKFNSQDLGTLIYPMELEVHADIVAAAKKAYLEEHPQV